MKATGCIIIMQRLHQDDLVGHVLEQEPWEVLSFPAIAEEDEEFLIEGPFRKRLFKREVGEALHPEREPLEAAQNRFLQRIDKRMSRRTPERETR
jgi:hypothetical protein